MDNQLQTTWHEAHRTAIADSNIRFLDAQNLGSTPSLWVASVVPAQSQLWANYPHVRFLTLNDVPLQGMYATFGIDRALSLWGAIATVGSPALVIDCGTALTFTAADAHHRLIGGAILPGLRLQFESLGQKTAMLPPLATSHSPLPTSRWSLNTKDAIASGILHTVTAGILSFVQDWWQQYPDGKVVMTGGDGDRLHQYLHHLQPELARHITLDAHLIFAGMRAVQLEEISQKDPTH